ncbi:LacI family DNA-binding transcriptional regulator [Paenibacillus sp. Marseille-P2973]|uniref:LacI family DNA-binding transcriptional regulator n=1 Tax=Paenibacillus TaxID=44249 RepID=UPI001B3721B7|nr:MULTISPECIES: LacI family DNA-binding transcriptional regulator [Paenibacillus]MBQ4900707.1 LacI family DNA-binding transcriptional regulator [Paenibacillus sp. Marseille-P2973]MDN4067949.1 LacI family DNA-binding transcriptional regulator [Paenibacillus vini]
MASITIIDIAKMCGVGVTTVSRAINNHPDISEETKAMIMQVIKENHYVPNNSARNLKRSASKTIAVLIKGITNPFFNRMIQVFEKEIQRKKYSFILQRVDENQDEIEVAIELEKEKRLKGIVFLGGYFSHSKEKLDQLTVPFVLSTIGMTPDYDPHEYSSVSVDDFKESYKMVDYLCNQGHRKIAIITASMDDVSIGKLRYEGYKQALEDHGLELNDKLVYSMKENIESYSMENGYEVTKELLSSGEEFTALFAVSDSLAVGACKAIFESGKSVPEDYAVAGFDGLDITYYYHPSITTIRQPVEEIAEETIKILFDLINKKITHAHKTFPAELMIRESTARK